MLGTCFYDRLGEVSRLSQLLEAGWSVLVVGPRNSGKSELTRYVVSRMAGVGGVVYVDARRLAARSPLGDALELVRGIDVGEVLRVLGEIAVDRLGLAGLLAAVSRLASRLQRRVYLVVDEAHLLADAAALEAAAKMVMSYREYRGTVLVATSSEGYMMDYEALARLAGYRVEFLLVAEMDDESFEALYTEYCREKQCRLGLGLIRELAGNLPGYLPELADATGDLVRLWIQRRAELLDAALLAVAEKLGAGYGEALSYAYSLLAEGKPAETPAEYHTARILVRYNIAYPEKPPRLYRPQLRVYLHLLEAAKRAGAIVTSVVDDVYGKLMGGQ